MKKTTTLWYVEHVGNQLGIWEREWADTPDSAAELYRELCDKYEIDPNEDNDMIGEYGDVALPQSVEVALTPDGVFYFASNYAGNWDV